MLRPVATWPALSATRSPIPGLPGLRLQRRNVAFSGRAHQEKHALTITPDDNVPGCDVQVVDVLEDHGPPRIDPNRPPGLVDDAHTDMFDVKRILLDGPKAVKGGFESSPP